MAYRMCRGRGPGPPLYVRPRIRAGVPYRGSGPFSLLGGVPDPGRGYHTYGKVRPWASSGRKGGARHGKKHDEKAEDDKAKKDKKEGSSY